MPDVFLLQHNNNRRLSSPVNPASRPHGAAGLVVQGETVALYGNSNMTVYLSDDGRTYPSLTGLSHRLRPTRSNILFCWEHLG